MVQEVYSAIPEGLASFVLAGNDVEIVDVEVGNARNGGNFLHSLINIAIKVDCEVAKCVTKPSLAQKVDG